MAAAADLPAGHWMAKEDPGFRNCIVRKMANRFVQVLGSQQDSHFKNLLRNAVKFEEEAFNKTNNKVDYMKLLSNKVMEAEGQLKQIRARLAMARAQNLRATPQNSGLMPNQHRACPSAPNVQVEVKQGQAEMTAVLDKFLGFNTTADSSVAPSVHPSQRVMQPSATQKQNQHPAMQQQSTNLARYNPTCSLGQLQGQPVVGQDFQQNHVVVQNASVTGIQKRQLAEAQQQRQLMIMNQQGMRGNQQQIDTQRNQFLRARQANLAIKQSAHPGVQNNQQNSARIALLQSPVKMGHHPTAPPQQHTTVDQQSSLVCQSPQNSAPAGNPGEVDWEEELFEKIKSFKDAYYSELVEFYKRCVIPRLTQEQFLSLPSEKAQQYHRKVGTKQMIVSMLKFLEIPRDKMSKDLQGHFPKFLKRMQDLRGSFSKAKVPNGEIKGGSQTQNGPQQPHAPYTCDKSMQKKHQEQLTDAKTSKMEQTIITPTEIAHQRNHACHQLLGVASPCCSIRSPEAVQPLATKHLEECLHPSSVAKPGPVQVASPYASPNASAESPVTKPGIVQVASPSTSVKSRLPSPMATPGIVQVASPRSPVKSTSRSPFAKPGAVQVSSPRATLPSPFTKDGSAQVSSPRASVNCTLQSPVAKPQAAHVASTCSSVESMPSLDIDCVAEFLMDGTAAANGSNQVNPTEPLISAPPLKAESAAHKAQVAKKPISRLVQAVLSSSPEVLRRSANAMRLLLSEDIPVPPPCQPWQWHGKMKRDFDQVTSRAISSPLSSTDDSCVTFDCGPLEVESRGECGVKRQKTENASNVLLEEIETINSKLIDTVISIIGENGPDGFTSCSYGGALIKLSYSPVSIAPSLKSLFPTSEMALVMPVKLFVPADYPKRSPVLVDDGEDEELRKLSDMSVAVAVAFRRALGELPEPRSVEETARAWDGCVRRAVTEVAHRHGGGTFSTRHGRWESFGCIQPNSWPDDSM